MFSKMNDKQIEMFYRVYYRIRYNDEMQKEKSYGKENPNKIFYVIRPRQDCVEGLLSLFWNVMRNIEYAKENEYIPVVDFKNYKTQYSFEKKENAWDMYFDQPSKFSLDEVYKSKNVILSGLEIQWYKKNKYKPDYSNECISHLHSEVFSCIDFSDKTKECVNNELKKMNCNLSDTIGLYLRGTDYIKLKPAGHPVQPTVGQAINIVDQFMKRYKINKVFLVTEDGEIYDKVKKKYGQNCIVASFDKYIYNYDGNKFLSNDKVINDLGTSAYERAMNYLVKMIILSKCGYLVGGNTNGMWAANVFADKTFKDKYIFELGEYGK